MGISLSLSFQFLSSELVNLALQLKYYFSFNDKRVLNHKTITNESRM